MNSENSTPVEELSASASWSLLRSAAVGRLAVVVGGHPDIFPVNHLVDHGTILFRTAPGTKLAAASGQLVAFEVDGYDNDTRQAWSVVVKGTAKPITQLHEVLKASEQPLTPWHEGRKPYFLRIEPDTMTGRRFVVHGADSSGDTG